ncbi:unnamed protein product [Oppiella nova]|uniref:Reactive oxygen species modulator 1 n=1 Tax=Oppiella nova TaxID=334625 RepID=A0A7R9L8D7_9ACAR|nr:unnamed protein product [Oppiella nova]CAG2159065.1 unnamed protein product [Oppiella nova]
MPVTGSVYGGSPQRSTPKCWDRVKYGFAMGMCVGLASGGVFGGVNALRLGLRGRELLSSMAKVMIQGGGTFGTFMAIGTAIRC